MPPLSDNEFSLLQTLTQLRTDYRSKVDNLKAQQSDLLTYEARVSEAKKKILDWEKATAEILTKTDETRKLFLMAAKANDTQLTLEMQEVVQSTEQLGRTV